MSRAPTHRSPPSHLISVAASVQFHPRLPPRRRRIHAAACAILLARSVSNVLALQAHAASCLAVLHLRCRPRFDATSVFLVHCIPRVLVLIGAASQYGHRTLD
ncbi:hypothetical protein B0H16DRAFT_1712856 [Mycena metata]|uniref:Uncharacterized protein n=1 Tax=Mycena metata TaxID=1033252 RepID=A0AAD7JZV1_9AGAR|nr:hypothetical protein B0H16DRAFT_1712856 [Mycena metata]